MKSQIKEKIKESTILYKIWYSINKKKLSRNIRLPKANDDYYIDGFPRSGNTYVTGYLNKFYPNINYAHHLHTIAALKIALKKDVEPIILIRNPLDSVASLSIMKSYYQKGNLEDEDFLNEILNAYIRYYYYVLKNKESIEILPFNKIKNTESLKYFFQKIFSKEVKTISTKELNEFDLNIRKHQRKKPNERTSTPNIEREKIKNSIKEKILKLEEYKTALSLFKKLSNEKARAYD